MTQEMVSRCPHCGSENVYAITRVTGYFSKTSMWNNGKIGELRERHRTTQNDWKYKNEKKTDILE
jgi:ribonucleoside-triphosphate reductase